MADCDILVENFKTGTLERYGLGYEQLKSEFPRLIYCSVTGFGQTGPYAARPGYDGLIQAMGGVMSLTGVPDGEPMKVAVPICDLMAGMYATVGILAAVRHQAETGEGQFIDIGMLDTHIGWLANQGMNYLATGENPDRIGNMHPNILPYQVMPTSDGYIVLSVGNDPTFERFCKLAECEHLLEDERFQTNAARVANRDHVTSVLNEITNKKPSAWWLEELEREKIGCGPINNLAQVFDDPHVKAREMVVEMEHPAMGTKPMKLIANPIKLSKDPADLSKSTTDAGPAHGRYLEGSRLVGRRDRPAEGRRDRLTQPSHDAVGPFTAKKTDRTHGALSCLQKKDRRDGIQCLSIAADCFFRRKNPCIVIGYR